MTSYGEEILTGPAPVLVDEALRPLRAVPRGRAFDAAASEPAHERLIALTAQPVIERRMVELNVSAGVRSLGKTSILQKSWAKRNAPIIHGWVYDLEDGLLRDLDCDMVNTDQLDDIYKFDLSGG